MVSRSYRSSHDWVRSYLDTIFRETDAASTYARDVHETQEAENVSYAAKCPLYYLKGLLAHCPLQNLSTKQDAGRVTMYRRTVKHSMQGNFMASPHSVCLGHVNVVVNSGFQKPNKDNEQDHDN